MEYVQQRKFLRRPRNIFGENLLESQYTNLIVWGTPNYKSSRGERVKECAYYGRDLTWDGGCQVWQRFKNNPLTEGGWYKDVIRDKKAEEAREDREVEGVFEKEALKRIQQQLGPEYAVIIEGDEHKHSDDSWDDDSDEEDDYEGTIYSRCTNDTDATANTLPIGSPSGSTSSVDTFIITKEARHNIDIKHESFSWAGDVEESLRTNKAVFCQSLETSRRAKTRDKTRLGYKEAKLLMRRPFTRNIHFCPWKRTSLGYGKNIFDMMALHRLEHKTRFEQTPSLLVTDFDTGEHYEIHEARKPLSEHQINAICKNRHPYPRYWALRGDERRENWNRADKPLVKLRAIQWWVEAQRIHDDRFAIWLREEQELDARELMSISAREVEKTEIEFIARFTAAVKMINPDEIYADDYFLIDRMEKRKKILDVRAKKQAKVDELLVTELEVLLREREGKRCRDIRKYRQKMQIWSLAHLTARCAAEGMVHDSKGMWVGEHHTTKLTEPVLSYFVKNWAVIKRYVARISISGRSPYQLQKGSRRIGNCGDRWERLTERIARQRDARSLKVYRPQQFGRCDWGAAWNRPP
jgi:hypothetical protein